MNLNKHKKTKNKFIYDGKQITRIGKKELYPFVYKRIWDLTPYDKDILQSYGLNKAMYIYIGSSNKYNLIDRCSAWKYEIVNNIKNISKDIRAFISKLKLFYELEMNYTPKRIDYLLYYNASIIARCESLQGARKLEKHLTTHYHSLDFYGEILEPQTILLSKVDSQLKEIKDGSVMALKKKVA